MTSPKTLKLLKEAKSVKESHCDAYNYSLLANPKYASSFGFNISKETNSVVLRVLYGHYQTCAGDDDVVQNTGI